MQKPSERHKLTSDSNIIKFKKPVHDPFNHLQSRLILYMMPSVLKSAQILIVFKSPTQKIIG